MASDGDEWPTWLIAVIAIELHLQKSCIYESKMVNYRERLYASHCGARESRNGSPEIDGKRIGGHEPPSPLAPNVRSPSATFNTPKNPSFRRVKTGCIGLIEPRSHRSPPAQVPLIEGTLCSIDHKVGARANFNDKCNVCNGLASFGGVGAGNCVRRDGPF